MPSAKSILADLLSVRVILTTLVGLGGVIVAFTKPFGSPELDQIVGLVLGAAAFGIVVLNAYLKAFAAGRASLRRG